MKQTNRFRTSRIESLERRIVLSTIPAFELMGNVLIDGDTRTITLSADVPMHIGIDGWDAESSNLSYSISSSNPDVAARIIENGQTTLNRSIVMTVEYVDNGVTYTNTMTFELFEERVPGVTARLIELINDDFYNSEDQDYTMLFHRVIEDFMMQGGDPTGTGTSGSGIEIDDEFNVELRHTGSGTLSLAKSRDDTGDSQFFLTDAEARWLDFQHTMFGQLTEGEDVRNFLNSVATTTSDNPISDIVIRNIEIIEDTENAVLMLSADAAAIGANTTVTVTVTDGDGDTHSKDYVVTVEADTINDPPFLEGIGEIHTEAGVPEGFTPSGIDVEGDFVFYGVWDADYWNSPYKDSFVIDYDPTGGTVVLTPRSDGGGVTGVLVGATSVSPALVDYRDVRPEDWGTQLKDEIIDLYQGTYTNYYTSYYNYYTGVGYSDAQAASYADSGAFTQVLNSYNATWDFQFVPVYVHPTTPTGIALDGGSDTGLSQTDRITNIDGGVGEYFDFIVSGTTPGASVSIYIDGQLAGSATATSNSTVVSTTSFVQLDDGQHQITARQTLYGQEIRVGNHADKPGVENPVDLEGDLSDPLSFWVDTASANIAGLPSPNALEASPYSSLIQADEPVRYTLLDGPAGITVHPTSGLIQWTPGHAYGGEQVDVTIQATDVAGNTSEYQYTITVEDVDYPPQLAAQGPTAIASGTTYNASVTATDPDDKATSFRFEMIGTAPEGLVLNESTGAIQWDVPDDFQGNVALEIRVTELLAGGEESGVATVGLGVVVYDAEQLAAQIAMQELLSQQESSGSLLGDTDSVSNDPLDLLATSQSARRQRAVADRFYSALGSSTPISTSSIGGLRISPYDTRGRTASAVDSQEDERNENAPRPIIQDAGILLRDLAIEEYGNDEAPVETETAESTPEEVTPEENV